MTKRIAAIAFIFVCTSVAWAVLGGTVFSRTYSLDAIAENRVASTWGAPQNQAPPVGSYVRVVPRNEESTENGKKIVKTVKDEVTMLLPLESSAIDVALDLQHRQKVLLWYTPTKLRLPVHTVFATPATKKRLSTLFSTSQLQMRYMTIWYSLWTELRSLPATSRMRL